MFGAIKSAFTSSGLQKPKYKEGDKHEGFEIRHYEPCKWVSTTSKSMKFKESSSKSFWKLFNYISGENDRKQKVDMTAPVTTQVVPGAGPNCESTFTMSFYIPTEHQTDPPQPSNSEVSITDWPQMTVAVRSFSGFASQDDWIKAGRELGELLDKDGLGDRAVQEYYLTAGYDSPFKLMGRVNEVWFVLKDSNVEQKTE